MGQPRSLFRLFLVKNEYIFYNKSMWKNVNSIQYRAPWFEHNLSNMSRLPKPLDHGSRSS